MQIQVASEGASSLVPLVRESAKIGGGTACQALEELAQRSEDG